MSILSLPEFLDGLKPGSRPQIAKIMSKEIGKRIRREGTSYTSVTGDVWLTLLETLDEDEKSIIRGSN